MCIFCKMKECPVCYVNAPDFQINCGHSFCYRCIKHWYQESETQTCPLCREHMEFREVYVECDTCTDVFSEIASFERMYVKLSNMKVDVYFDDVMYFMSKPWCLFVSQNNVSCSHTRYIFIDYGSNTKITEYGLRTKKACHQKRQEESETSVLTKTYKG